MAHSLESLAEMYAAENQRAAESRARRAVGTSKTRCVECKGTGADENKTAEMVRAFKIDVPAYVRCWSCNGNGLEP